MGKLNGGGKVATPTVELKLRGSKRATRNRAAAELKPREGAPVPPIELTVRERAEWDRLCSELEFMGILAAADCNALARYCRMWIRWIECEVAIARDGSTQTGESGRVFARPEVSESFELAHKLLQLEQQFGLTPSARVRVPVKDVKIGDPSKSKERFFRAG